MPRNYLTMAHMQKIIAKKIRAKKSMFYSNKSSDRKWGPKQVKATTKEEREEQTKIIQQQIFNKSYIKKEQGIKQCKKVTRRYKQKTYNLEQTTKILDLFQVDSGNFAYIMSELPNLKRKPVRLYVRRLFLRAVQAVMEMGTPLLSFTPLSYEQKREVIKEMMRTRATNRLLSQADGSFRTSFLKVVRNLTLNTDFLLSKSQIIDLLHRILQFPRGTRCVLMTPSTQVVSQPTHFRPFILQGGRILNGVKREEQKKWKMEEEKHFLTLIVEGNTHIKEGMEGAFGTSAKWADFSLIEGKISLLIHTSLRRLEMMEREDKKSIFKNVSTIEKQISVYRTNSNVLIPKLMHILLDQNELTITQAIEEVKSYHQWANRQDDKDVIGKNTIKMITSKK